MIIPIKCFTCGMLLADKYLYYLNRVKKEKTMIDGVVNMDRVSYLTKQNMEITPEGKVLNELQLTKPCCRRHFLTHVDID